MSQDPSPVTVAKDDLRGLLGGGAELNRVLEATGGASVCEGRHMFLGELRKSAAKEQASRVLWLYCFSSVNL